VGGSETDMASENASISTHGCDWTHSGGCPLCQVLLVVVKKDVISIGYCYYYLVDLQLVGSSELDSIIGTAQ
jgi:hypothetical protein